ncbi:hypothetical protein HJC99_02890 [Candidatus Saccharibacteria bacterium]|nr:hypothetical protein [Candidatus Saccharibacteria bacterium]
MTKHKRLIVIELVAATIVLVAAGFAILHGSRTSSSQQGSLMVIKGTVTSYVTSQTATDGPIAFAIDGQTIDIGAATKSGTPPANVYSPIKVGDKVTAKVVTGSTNTYTILNCPSCYVKHD